MEKHVAKLGYALDARKLKENELLDLENMRAELFETINSKRQEERDKLYKALDDYDSETRKLTRAAESSINYEIKHVELQNAIGHIGDEICGAMEEINKGNQNFIVKDETYKITVIKTSERKSNGITLKSVSQALVDAGKFPSPEEASRTIQTYNKSDQITVKVLGSDGETSIDISKLFEKPKAKRGRKAQ